MKSSNRSLLAIKNKIKLLYVIGGVLLAASFLMGIFTGSTVFTFSDLISVFKNGIRDTKEGRIFLYVRLIRPVSAIFCGMALSVAGVILQSVLSNNLASPGIIGVNAGAGFAVTLCASLSLYSGWITSIFSFLGAFFTVLLVSIFSQKFGATRSAILLIGVALNSLLGAFSDTIITFVPEVSVISNDFKVGDFSGVTYERIIPALIIIIVTIAVAFLFSNEMDIITLGDEQAKGLGLNCKLMRTIFLLIAAILSGCAVSIAGLLSFVGLIIPNIIRRIIGNKSMHLLSLSVLFGGGFLCLCDTVSRTVFSPYEIPVGIIMAFLGAPFFIFILIKGGKNRA